MSVNLREKEKKRNAYNLIVETHFTNTLKQKRKQRGYFFTTLLVVRTVGLAAAADLIVVGAHVP